MIQLINIPLIVVLNVDRSEIGVLMQHYPTHLKSVLYEAFSGTFGAIP